MRRKPSGESRAPLFEGGKVRRIIVGPGSGVKPAEGAGIGSAETHARGFAGFRSEPHKCKDAPAKYLTAPNAGADSAMLPLEIGADRPVKAVQASLISHLAFVEGCGQRIRSPAAN